MNCIDLCELCHDDEFCRVSCCVTFDQVGEYVIVDYALVVVVVVVGLYADIHNSSPFILIPC